jgi:hypothetical protein
MDPTLIRLPIGISDFQKLIIGKYQFADKTLFIKDIINDGADVILITRPRRFGKTLNLSMLNYFLQIDPPQHENLFAGLAISKDQDFCKEHQNKYPVIFVSFKSIKYSNFVDAYSGIKELLRKLYEEHKYLLDGDILSEPEKVIFEKMRNKTTDDLADIGNAIANLTLYVKRQYNQLPIVLIDEYDTPIQESYLQSYYAEMIDLMRIILGQALKDNTILHKAVVTGITRIAQESLFSGVNNLEVYSLLREEYGEYFGFSEEEVIKLLSLSAQSLSIEPIKEWYNGYQVGKYVLYNPWSIINCLKNHGKLKPYWLHTASNGLINKLLIEAKSKIKQQFEALLQGKTIEQAISENLVFADIDTKEEALWSLLLYAGYLKVISSELIGSRLIAQMSIPNKEVSFVYDEIVEGWFSRAISLESYDSFVRSLFTGDMDKFKIYLSNYIMQSGSYFDFNSNTSEQVFHVFVLGLVVGLRDRYSIYSNHESGLGRFDVIFMPKNKGDKGIVLEFKKSASVELLLNKAQEALEQINTKEYVTIFKQAEVIEVIAIGMSFCGKKMELVYENIEVLKQI